MRAKLIVALLAGVVVAHPVNGQTDIRYTFGPTDGPGITMGLFNASFSSSNTQLSGSQFFWAQPDNGTGIQVGSSNSQSTSLQSNTVGMRETVAGNTTSFVRLSLTGSAGNFRHAEMFLTTNQNTPVVNAGIPNTEHTLRGLFAKPNTSDISYVSFSARVRTNARQAQDNPVGIVSAFFGFPRGAGAVGATNEIDFEILRQNTLNGQSDNNLLLSSHHPSGLTSTAVADTVSYAMWNTYEFRQYSDRVEFYLNDVRLASGTPFPATAGQNLAPTFNIWAPGSGFGNVYVDGNSTLLVPTYLDVESFSYRIQPVPEPAHILLVVTLGGLARQTYRKRMRRA
jgi:hypothetical protein